MNTTQTTDQDEQPRTVVHGAQAYPVGISMPCGGPSQIDEAPLDASEASTAGDVRGEQVVLRWVWGTSFLFAVVLWIITAILIVSGKDASDSDGVPAWVLRPSTFAVGGGAVLASAVFCCAFCVDSGLADWLFS